MMRVSRRTRAYPDGMADAAASPGFGAGVSGLAPKRVEPWRGRREAGFGLLVSLFAMGIAVLLLGAGIDLGHVVLIRDGAQALADEAALSAARELDGTWTGLLRARKRAREALARLDRMLEGDAKPRIEVEFAADARGPWRSSPAAASGLRFVRVQVAAGAKLFFLPMIPQAPAVQAFTVRAVAGQTPAGAGARVDAAFEVEAPAPEAPEFGFADGGTYECARPEPGECRRVLEQRLLSDTDPLSRTYAEYAERGNGQRVVIAGVRSSGGRLLGYATFLVPPAAGRGRCELIYAGAAPLAGVRRNGAGPAGLYEVRLVR